MEKVLGSKNVRNTILLSRNDVLTFLYSLFGFFLGRAIIFGVLNPFAIAFLALFCFEDYKFYFICVSILIGIFTVAGKVSIAKYVVAIFFMAMVNLILSKKYKRASVVYKVAVGGICIFVAGLIMAFFNHMSLYFTLLAVLELILVCSLVFIFHKGIAMFKKNVKKRIFGSEELVSICILLGSIVAGTGDIYFGTISFSLCLSTILILFMGYKCGATMGASAGVLLGFVLLLSENQRIELIGVLSIAGLMGGIMRDVGKVASAIGFIAGGTIVLFYFDKSLLSLQLMFAALIGGGIFLLIPKNVFMAIATPFDKMALVDDVYASKVKELSSSKLKSFANSFTKLSETFSGLSEKKTGLTQKDVSMLIDDVASKACSNCSLKQYCWEKNFYNTYQTVFSILAACEKKGKIELEDIPSDFKTKCANVIKFTEVTNKMYEIYKTNLFWHNRIVESRELVSEQLMGVASIIGNLAEELDVELEFKEEIEEAIFYELDKNNLGVDRVIVLENKYGKYEVSLSCKSCYGKRSCSKEIIPIINRIIGRKMKQDSTACIIDKKDGNCKVRLVEEQKYRVTTGVAREIKTNSRESGDSYTFMELRGGQCLIALSDGMGSGSKAKEESTAAIELLEQFIESGFEKDLAIKMINSVLVLKSNNESFSTLDICAIDLYSGLAEFVKIGAASTFLIRDGEVEVIKSSSLPVGIVNEVDFEVTKRKLKSSDMILMITDGVVDTNENLDIEEKWVCEVLANFKSGNPQDVADYILYEAKNHAGKIIRDDMTVVAAKIWEK